ncbi:MAG TPA: GNAT family N-acetyltransferase [Nocardioides sp.]|uniref:GNAT family N-acetyltransferase n=1 Tax=Nocardioides sp. TaxID=35761 RepID=UPI002E2F3369|nr:GNAT family N-acetyltransferase [Nocardioides sp.]HEX5089406.1 GNAT family N-acetyltransferase [Nocardioides sp.]
MIRHEVLDRTSAAAVVAEVARWDAGTTYAPLLHTGDLGWHLRLADEVLAGTVHAWWADRGLVAVALIEGATSRPRACPDLIGDAALAVAVADVVDAGPHPELWSDVVPGSALRNELVRRGWELDPDPWVSLYASAERWEVADRGVVRLGSAHVRARVTVQRNGFERSTFDEPTWHRMAAGPGFRADLDLVVLDDGAPAAAATGWLSVPGGPAILEPLATHPAHRGRGFGRAVTAAIVDACLAAGASGVSVATPQSNTAAVATYVSAGFRPVETVQALTIRR